MASNIDTTKPTAGAATTQSVRDNFTAARNEILALQQAVAGIPTMIDDAAAAAIVTAVEQCHPPYIALAALDLYVAAGGDDNQTGQFAPQNFATLAGAVAYAQRIDNAGYGVFINLPHGTYQGGITITGLRTRALLTIRGPSPYPYANGQTAHITAGANYSHLIHAAGGNAYVQLQNLALSSPGYGNNLASASSAGRLQLQDIEFRATTGANILAYYDGLVSTNGNTVVTGNAQNHITAAYGGHAIMTTGTITFVGSITYTGAFIAAAYNSDIVWRNKTKVSNCTANRTALTFQSLLDNNTAAQNTIPGTVDGTPATGSAIY
jgi:hypothetical protein